MDIVRLAYSSFLGPKSLESLIDVSVLKQQIQFSGNVTDGQTGEPLVGVNVVDTGDKLYPEGVVFSRDNSAFEFFLMN